MLNLNAIPSIYETRINKSDNGRTGYHLIHTGKDTLGSSYSIEDA